MSDFNGLIILLYIFFFGEMGSMVDVRMCDEMRYGEEKEKEKTVN